MKTSWIRWTLLAATVLPVARGEFRLSVVSATGEQDVPALYSLGTVLAGETAQTRFRLRNISNTSAILNYLEVRGTGFGPRNPLPLPVTLEAQAAVDFVVTFSAPETGTYSAALDSEGVATILTVKVSAAPALPPWRVLAQLPRAESGQQGSAALRFDGPATRSGSGTLTLQFQPEPAGATDGSVTFASGQGTVGFTFARGDTDCLFNDQTAALFQTGTTAGTLTLTARIGTASEQSTVVIAPAPVRVTQAHGMRSGNSLEVQVTGFDNARTAGPLAFTFYDASGAAIPPGTMQIDAGGIFQEFYRSSDAGGTFLLRAVFPVTGDISQIAAFEASIANSEGATTSPRTKF